MYTQANRPIWISGSFPEDSILLEEVVVEEEISKPFRIICRVLVPDLGANLEALLWQPIHVGVAVNDVTRHFHGRVNEVRLLDHDDPFAIWEIEAAPNFWFFNLHTDCRIFQNKSVDSIVRSVLKRDTTLEMFWGLNSTYDKREYCVQYKESDFQFVSRLLEDEGIYYYFTHRDDGHLLNFGDYSPTAKPTGDGTPIPYAATDDVRGGLPSLSRMQRKRQVRTANVAMNDYNFETPRGNLNVMASKESFPQRYDYPGNYMQHGDGEKIARIRLQEIDCRETVFEGRSTAATLQAGFCFEVEDHPSKSMNGKYLLTSVRHRAVNPAYRSREGGEDFQYYANWQAIPAALPFRPARITPRSYVPGSQTAIVTGVEMDKPHTEEFGRVKLHFFWHRWGKPDANSSCWVRVSQPWAGRNWGSVSIPRVGQEVIVDFIEGDPDRPIITGRVYNGDMMPPYSLPGGAANMGMRSRTIGGGGYNEISINDSLEGEGITIHAQKDMSTVVENNETIEVKNNRTEKVGVDEKITIGNNRTEEVGADESVTVKGNRTGQVLGHDVLTVAKTRTTSVGINDMQNVGIAQQITVGALQMINVAGVQMLNAGFKQTLFCGGETLVKASGKLVLEGPGGTITIDDGGITIKGKQVFINC